VTLVNLPHHGSRRSSPELLLDALHPHAAFVSVGAGNAFGFPHTEVVEELERRKIPLSRTDRDGTVRLVVDGSGWRRECWKNGLFR
jgi:competence protein ComEC